MKGLHFWAAGYCVSTLGLDETRVRQYIREQEEQDDRQGKLDLAMAPTRPSQCVRPPWGGLPNTSASGRGWLFGLLSGVYPDPSKPGKVLGWRGPLGPCRALDENLVLAVTPIDLPDDPVARSGERCLADDIAEQHQHHKLAGRQD